MATMNDYKYQSLPSGPSIRLLAIHPAKYLDEPLVCDVRVISLDESHPDYAALSYTWGNNTANNNNDVHYVICNGQKLAITTNLNQALRRFREFEACEYIWADAICINQRDNMERNTQILLMKRIYQQSRMTFIFLGEQEDQPQTPNAVEYVEKSIFQPLRALSEPSISISSLIRCLHHQDNRRTTAELLKYILYSVEIPQKEDWAPWMSWQILLTRPWFSRIWVIQEATAAPERTVVQVGAFRLTWNDFVAANAVSLEFLSESDVNLGFSMVGGYHIGRQRLDAVEAITRWKANRVNLEAMEIISQTVHSGRDSLGVLLGSRRKMMKSDPDSSSPVQYWARMTRIDYVPDHLKSQISLSSSTKDRRGTSSLPITANIHEQGQTDARDGSFDNDSISEPAPKAAEGENNADWRDVLRLTAKIQSLHLFQLLKRCCNFKASDPRDHLYGLLGLATDANMAPKPDYGKSTEQIYRQFAEYFVSQGYGIELLSMSDSRMNLSWVPDFAALGQNVPGHSQGWDFRHFANFQAGGSTRGPIMLNGDRLIARGIIVNSVVALGPPLRSSSYFASQAKSSDDEQALKKFERHITKWDQETTIFIQKAYELDLFQDDPSQACHIPGIVYFSRKLRMTIQKQFQISEYE
ncbi:heterokaryon incompatibility domain-containing protein [Trichoderma sp. SZMC 28012]